MMTKKTVAIIGRQDDDEELTMWSIVLRSPRFLVARLAGTVVPYLVLSDVASRSLW